MDNIMTLKEAMQMLQGEMFVWEITANDDYLVKVRLEEDVFVLEPVERNKEVEI